VGWKRGTGQTAGAVPQGKLVSRAEGYLRDRLIDAPLSESCPDRHRCEPNTCDCEVIPAREPYVFTLAELEILAAYKTQN